MSKCPDCKAKDSELEKLHQDMSVLRQQNEDLRDANANLLDKLDQWEAIADDRRKELDVAQQQIDRLKALRELGLQNAELAKRMIEMQHEEIETLTAELDRLKADLREYKDLAKSLQDIANGAKQDGAEIMSLEREIERLKAELGNMERQVEGLVNLMAEDKIEIKRLRDALRLISPMAI